MHHSLVDVWCKKRPNPVHITEIVACRHALQYRHPLVYLNEMTSIVRDRRVLYCVPTKNSHLYILYVFCLVMLHSRITALNKTAVL